LLCLAISVRPTSEPLNLKTLLLNCLDFLFNAIDSKINAIILENVERFCESSRIGEANKQDFFRHFRLELDDNEEAGLQTMVGEVRIQLSFEDIDKPALPDWPTI
jgi:hypothetical protein